ncbi:MAG: peptide chain release factor 3 [Nitrospirae bacterium]|nr:peptide chain release factor 3 [Nitrospirota bacterium]MCL5286098.1 peptide chain release factor 3 [Nitrospirota bacterium]
MTTPLSPEASPLLREIVRRRTFAIISHPDAGKTTLTEKLLLYGGAIHLAGSIKARKAARYATSDWMEIERQRGISVTSSALAFEFEDHTINILDTPGHKDFSEDTFRTLEAVDSVVMLLDGAKGIEPQTLKLFEVARMRQLPILTFINKVDREGVDPFNLLSDIERTLDIAALPFDWPIGSGTGFRGVWDLRKNEAHLYEAVDHGGAKADERILAAGNLELEQVLGTLPDREAFLDEIALLSHEESSFDTKGFLAGRVTPVFFGSALNNFGVELFLRAFLEMAPPPRAYHSDKGPVPPDSPFFSGFVFKIQANMDPQHRDRFAFIRVCSGRFFREMTVTNATSGKSLRLSKTIQFLGQKRERVEEAWPGDIIGLHDPGVFRIGDTLCEKSLFHFEGIPSFSPELFARVILEDPLKRKHLKKGLDQLSEEGAIQVFQMDPHGERDLIVGAVGALQLEVLKFRLEHEYNVRARLEPVGYDRARWLAGNPEQIQALSGTLDTLLVYDHETQPVALFRNEWALRYVVDKYPGITFHGTSPRVFHEGG